MQITKKLGRLKKYLWKKTDPEGTSNTPHSGSEANSSAYITPTTNEALPNTPFRIIGSEKGWFIVLGNSRLTNYYPTEKLAQESLEQDRWNVLINTIVTVVNQIQELQKQTAKPPTQNQL